MKSSKRLMAPSFLNRFDDWLLLNKPEAWTARTHLVLYYGGIFIVLLALLCYLFPDDPRTRSGSGNWSLFTSVIAIIGFVTWLIYLLRFNVFKRFGRSGPADRLKTFLLCFFATAIIMIIPFVQSLVESGKANAAFGDNEVVADMNQINTKIVQLEYDSLSHSWKRDTLRVVDSLPGSRARRTSTEVYLDDSRTTDVVTVAPRGMGLIDTADLRVRLAFADSTEKIDDSTYVFLECPQYVFVNNYQLDEYATVKRLESKDIFRKVVQGYQRPDREKVRAELLPLLDKYEIPLALRWRPEPVGPYNHLHTVYRRYSLEEVEEGLNNVVWRKNGWRGSGFNFLSRVFFYLSLVLSLLVFIFRHSTVKTFFLTLLSACLIAILSALFIGLTHAKFSGFFAMLAVYFVIFGGVTLFTWRVRTRHIIVGVAINLFVLLMAFIPFVIVAWYYNRLDETTGYRQMATDNRDFWYPAGELAGPLMLLVLIPVLVHRIYRRWYALPVE